MGNPGRDPFGHETRPPIDPVESVRRLGEYSGDIAEMVINDVVERKG